MKGCADLQTPNGEECILRGFSSSYINDAIEMLKIFLDKAMTRSSQHNVDFMLGTIFLWRHPKNLKIWPPPPPVTLPSHILLQTTPFWTSHLRNFHPTPPPPLPPILPHVLSEFSLTPSTLPLRDDINVWPLTKNAVCHYCNTYLLTVFIMTLTKWSCKFVGLFSYWPLISHISPSLTMFIYLPHWLCSLISLIDYVHWSPSLTIFTYLLHCLCSLISFIDYIHLGCVLQCLYQGERDFLEVLENDSKRNSGKNISSLLPKFRRIKST